MIADFRHQWPVTRQTGVVVKQVQPGENPVLGEVGVAQFTAYEVEQRCDAFDRNRGIVGCGRADLIA